MVKDQLNEDSTDLNLDLSLDVESVVKILEKEEKRIKVRLEKRRWGREVTIIEGLENSELERTAKLLKNKLACGGTYKDGRIELQGDHRSRVEEILVSMGYPKENIVVE
ncbi:MAG: stress response translation initiation inhibitor YciH [Thermoprotei archaeon]